jgi:CcmD family protein
MDMTQRGAGTRHSGLAIRNWKKSAILRMLAVATVCVLAFGAAASTVRAQQQPPGASDGFVPVDDLKPQEQIPAAPFVMAAYAVAWIAVFGYMWSIWQRLNRVERELAEVSRRVPSSGVRP